MEVIEESIFPEKRIVYAPFSSRLLAAILDGIILAVPTKLISLFIADAMGDVADFVVSVIIYWMYDAIQESGVRQATFGKRALNIRVTTLYDERISFAQATARHFGKYVSFLIILIGYFMMLWDDKNQCLHDKMAGTLVVSD